jgi:hypothetical protein
MIGFKREFKIFNVRALAPSVKPRVIKIKTVVEISETKRA